MNWTWILQLAGKICEANVNDGKSVENYEQTSKVVVWFKPLYLKYTTYSVTAAHNTASLRECEMNGKLQFYEWQKETIAKIAHQNT